MKMIMIMKTLLKPPSSITHWQPRSQQRNQRASAQRKDYPVVDGAYLAQSCWVKTCPDKARNQLP